MKNILERLIFGMPIDSKPEFVLIHIDDFNKLFLDDRKSLKVIRANKNQIRQYTFLGIKIIRTYDVKKGTVKLI